VSAVRAALAVDGLADAPVAECFALIREVCSRQLGLRHYPVQLMGGYAMLRGALAEMQTGEGKTLTAVLPAVTVALAGAPVHVITVNDYLASRDAAYLAPVYAFFGLRVGLIVPDQESAQRAEAYASEVTYCVNKDLVFDYLRDRITQKRGRAGARAAARQAGSPGRAGRRLGGVVARAVLRHRRRGRQRADRRSANAPDHFQRCRRRERAHPLRAGAGARRQPREQDALPAARRQERSIELTDAGRAAVAEFCARVDSPGAVGHVRIGRARNSSNRGCRRCTSSSAIGITSLPTTRCRSSTNTPAG
jgi:preprotein translocase subunit SecA